MERKNIDNYEALLISELESDIRKKEIGVAFFITVLFLLPFIIAFNVNQSRIIPLFISEIKNETVGESRQTINVSAYVPSFLGIKKIGEQWKNKTVIAYGNSEYGFNIADSKTQNIVFMYNKMPGEGIIIQLSKEIESFFFDSNF